MAGVITKVGTINYLRVHEVGTGYGPPNDHLDADVIVRFDGDEPRAYGFKLRNNDGLPVAQAMFALLQDAFNAGTPVTIDFAEVDGHNNHELIRVWRTT